VRRVQVWAYALGGAAVLAGVILFAGARAMSAGSTGAMKSADAAWDALVDEYFDQAYFKFQPTAGTMAGLHQYDPQLEDYSRGGVDREIETLRRFESRFMAADSKGLNEVQAADREILLGAIRGRLLTLETIRPWEKQPDTYSGGVTNSVYVILIRKFAPVDVRLKSAVAREKQIPAVFAEAQKNLKNPAKISAEIALEQLPGLINFFKSDVPAAFADATDAGLKAEFAKSNADVIAALGSYQDWLQKDLLPQSNGDFRIGAETFSKKLLYDEMVDIPLDRLLEIGKADLRKNQEEFRRIAKDISPDKTPQQVLEMLEKMHPAPDQLLATFRGTFDGLIAFIRDNHIITIPSEVRPTLQETPPFMRATTFASMDTPGPFERVAKEAYFNVTLPGPKDTPEQIEGRMEQFNRGTILSTSIHEAYPGHYIQFLWVPQAISKVRKLVGSNTNGEGWAHYCEQMMLDEGYGQPGVGAKDATDAKLLRLGQLQDALLRDARFVAGIEMHRGNMSFDQSVDFFVKEGYQSRVGGLTETKRGTSDPTYLYYTLGKLEILKLRADVKKKQGAAFSVEQFHNDFMKQGYPAIKIVRRAMLGNDSPVL
jgi:uncharacterized protein (DUF885 family)